MSRFYELSTSQSTSILLNFICGFNSVYFEKHRLGLLLLSRKRLKFLHRDFLVFLMHTLFEKGELPINCRVTNTTFAVPAPSLEV